MQQITGVQVRETVPDWVMQRVDEIVLADLTPQALQKRMQRGDIYPVDRAQRALSHFFRPGNLIALRELALRQVTGVVDRSLDAFLEKDGTQPAHTVRERIGVCVSSNPAAQYLIARGSRMAQAMGGEFYVFYVDVGRDTRPEDQKTLAENIRFAENLGARVVRTSGGSIADGACTTGARKSHYAGDFRPIGANVAGSDIFIYQPYSVFCVIRLRSMSTSLPRKLADGGPASHSRGGRRIADHARSAYQPFSPRV